MLIDFRTNQHQANNKVKKKEKSCARAHTYSYPHQPRLVIALTKLVRPGNNSIHRIQQEHAKEKGRGKANKVKEI